MNAGSSVTSRLSTKHAAQAPGRATADAGSISITWHENEIPAFAEAALERIYGSIFSSLAHFRIHGGAENAGCWVARCGTEITDILLFRREGRSIHVINEWIRFDEQDLRRFADAAFARYPTVNRISFHAIELDVERLPYPGQRFNCTDDSIVSLPDSADAYFAQLGKATRKNIKRYLTRLRQSFPDFRYQIYETGAIEEQHVRAIIGLNRLRMANKNKVSGIDDREADRMLQLLKLKGMVGVATIGGRLCAGALTYRIGDNYFSFVRAHEPQYDDYRLGLIGGYLLISECIARGGKEFHFMWGREEHKALLLGVQKEFDHLTLYRSRLHYLRDSRNLLQNAFTARMQQLKRRLLHGPTDPDPVWRFAAAALRRLRRSEK